MPSNCRALRALITSIAALLVAGCGQSTSPKSESKEIPASQQEVPAALALRFAVPQHVQTILKRKCYICHGGAEVEGGFDFKKMIYRPKPEAKWQPMDLAGVTRIKLAILPLDGKPARMPKKSGSTWNPLTEQETNTVAKWTDYPYKM